MLKGVSLKEIVGMRKIFQSIQHYCTTIAIESLCVLVKSGQIANPIIAMDDPVPYYSIRARFMFANLLIAKHRKTRNSQLIDTRN